MTGDKDREKTIMPRDQGGSVELKEGTGGIVAVCPCDDFLEIYKEDTTFRFETPDTIDPGRTNPNAPFVAVVHDRIGSANPIVARVLLQSRDILESAFLVETVDKKAVVRTLHGVKEALVACHKAAQSISHHVQAVSDQLTKDGVRTDRSGRVLPSLPQVPDLDATATQFLISAKRAIKGICNLVPLFLPVDRADSNLDHLAKRLEKLLGENAPLTTFVRKFANVSRYLIDLRNAQEHPQLGQSTRIDNVRVQPDGSVQAPAWYVTGNPPRPIEPDMTAAIERLIEMAEGTLIHLFARRLDTRWPFVIQELDQAAINPKQPMKYKLTLDATRINLPAANDGKTEG